MKVKELIESLQEYNQEAELLFYKNDGGGYMRIMCEDYDDFFPVKDENGENKLGKFTEKDTPYVTLVFVKDENHKPVIAKFKIKDTSFLNSKLK